MATTPTCDKCQSKVPVTITATFADSHGMVRPQQVCKKCFNAM